MNTYLRSGIFAMSLASLTSLCWLVSPTASADTSSFPPGTVILQGGGPGGDAPERHLQFIIMTPDACTLRDVVFRDVDPKTTEYPCHLLPGGVPVVARQDGSPVVAGQGGRFSMTFDLPTGSIQMDFKISGVGAAPLHEGTDSFFLPGLYIIKGPPQALDVRSTDALPPGAAHAQQVLHVVMNGLDCKFEIVGQGMTDCLLYNWSTGMTAFLVSGNYAKQPDQFVSITLWGSGVVWRMIPTELQPYTPAMLAAQRGDLKAANTLATQGADIGTASNGHPSPLDLAITHGHLDVAKALVDQGALANGMNQSGVPLIDIAISQDLHDRAGTLELVKDMVAHGADVNDARNYNDPPLFSAIDERDPALVEFLVEKGADVNAISNSPGRKISVYQAANGDPALIAALQGHAGSGQPPAIQSAAPSRAAVSAARVPYRQVLDQPTPSRPGLLTALWEYLGSKTFPYILIMLPNLLVGLTYLVFLKRPMKTRLQAALPNALFILIAILIIVFSSRYFTSYFLASMVVGKAVVFLVWGLMLYAYGQILFNIFKIRTWLNLMQLVGVSAYLLGSFAIVLDAIGSTA